MVTVDAKGTKKPFGVGEMTVDDYMFALFGIDKKGNKTGPRRVD